MRLVFYYSSISSGQPTKVDWERIAQQTTHPLMVNFHTEGIAWMMEQMLSRKIVDEYVVILECAKQMGAGTFPNGMKYYTVPHIDDTYKMLRDGDIIWARGGFRPWPPFLERMNKEKRWVLFYRAATNRGKWPYWDIILEDLCDQSSVDPSGRIVYKFNKPVRPEYFFADPSVPTTFDVLLNASHIHDKKGQYRGILAAIEFKKMFNRNVFICLPGGVYHGENTNKVMGWIRQNDLKVHMPGMVPRPDVGDLMRRSKLYVHLGGSGQNDRGALEAMCCGLPVLIGMPEFFPSFITSHPQHSIVVKSNEDYKEIAMAMGLKLNNYDPGWKSEIGQYYQEKNGGEVALQRMKTLFDFLREYPKADRARAAEVLVG